VSAMHIVLTNANIFGRLVSGDVFLGEARAQSYALGARRYSATAPRHSIETARPGSKATPERDLFGRVVYRWRVLRTSWLLKHLSKHHSGNWPREKRREAPRFNRRVEPAPFA
jgi:hypothetical protein